MTVDYRIQARPAAHDRRACRASARQLHAGARTLIRLHAASLLDCVPRRGFFAKTLDLKEMIDLFQLGFLVLKSAIERATEAADAGGKGALSPLVAPM